MPIFDNYPRADLHEMNLDWLLKTMKALVKDVEDLKKNGIGEIQNEVIEIDNSITIINNEIQNLYTMIGMFLKPVDITNAGRKATQDGFEIVEIHNI